MGNLKVFLSLQGGSMSSLFKNHFVKVIQQGNDFIYINTNHIVSIKFKCDGEFSFLDILGESYQGKCPSLEETLNNTKKSNKKVKTK